MIKNGFKKFLGVGLFILFSCLFSSNFCDSVNFNVNETTTINGVSITCDTNANCITEYNGDSFKGIANNPNRSQEGQVLFWREDGYIGYLRGNTWGAGSVRQAYQNVGCFANYTSSVSYTTTVLDYLNGCSQSTGNWESRLANSSMYVGKITSYTMNFDGGQGVICYNYNEELGSFCYYFTSTSGRMPDANYGITFPVTISKINSVAIYDSPFVGGGGDSGGGSLVPVFSDVDNAISYFENTKGYNESMCYVGTKNLTGVYGTTGVSFQEGTGDTIFQLYNSLYSGFGSNLVTNVGNFIDVWTLNYFQWFYNSNEEYGVRRLATYNGPDTLYDVYYENLTFPFTDNPVAIFFMASNLYDGYDNIYNYGSYVSSYCYLKLNYDNIKSGDIDYVEDVVPLLPSAIDNNIKDYVKYDFNYGNTGYYYSPEWIGSWTGDYELSGNLDLDGVFTNFLDNFNSKLGNIDFGYTFGIIPDWILYPLIFLILFRIMKH